MEKEQVENLIRQMFKQNEECRNLLAILANEHYRLELDINPEGIDSVTVTNRQKPRAAGIYLTFEDGREEAFVKPRTAKDAFLYVVEEYFGVAKSHELLPKMIIEDEPETHDRYKKVTDDDGNIWYIQYNRGNKNLVAAINTAFGRANVNCKAEVVGKAETVD